LRERFDIFRLRFRFRELARVDIHLIGRHDDGCDLRIGGTGALRPAWKAGT
jgi:hypothetical protein